MYGLILDSMANCIKHVYGDKIWQSVVGTADISSTVFTTHKIYDEQLIPMIANATSDITGIAIETIMESAGRHFINYIAQIRNDRITKVLGRTFKDFLIGLDCMHEYYRTNFNEIQPPSFQVAEEDSDGLEIHYRSRRTFTGFMYYVQGLLHAIAQKFFTIDVAIQITQHGFTGDAMLAVYRLDYNNSEYITCQSVVSAKRAIRSKNDLIFPMNAFFELFPFHVVFDERLLILSTGHGLDIICKGLERKRLNETFFMTRPLGCDLTWDNVRVHANNVFELTSVKSTVKSNKVNKDLRHFRMQTTHFIKLRGQMLYIEEWGLVIFLATFMMDDLNKMHDLGTFVNDLTFHDLSRDMVLHGPQQTTEYKLALDLEQGKNSRLEEMIENLGCNQRKIDDLLYSMIPKEIASSLRQGNTSVSLCEKYHDVTILFSDVVNFAKMCKSIQPHEIMKTLNMMVGIFDGLCLKFNTYKVETVADGFMCVSGAPTFDEFHAKNMADMAMEMLEKVKSVLDPNSGSPINIRIGLHCGAVIAGLVGHKIPRYCLFGDTVHIASKLEATSMSQKIQISDSCMEYLEPYLKYKMTKNAILNIKGRVINTFWLEENLDFEGTRILSPKCSSSPRIATEQMKPKYTDAELAQTGKLKRPDDRAVNVMKIPLNEAGKDLEVKLGIESKQGKQPNSTDEYSECRDNDSSNQTNSQESKRHTLLNELGMDETYQIAYENLMQSIGIRAPLNMITRKNNAILSAKPGRSTMRNDHCDSIFRNMLESEAFLAHPNSGNCVNPITKRKMTLPKEQVAIAMEKAFKGKAQSMSLFRSSVCVIM